MASLRQHDESAEKENSQRLVTLLGLDGKTISPTSYRPWGAICLDIPFYRTGFPECGQPLGHKAGYRGSRNYFCMCGLL